MNRLDIIQEIYDAEIKLIIKQSSMLLQRKEKGFNGELKTSGTIIENYIKGILKNHLPAGYKISSGYIATTQTISDIENLAQHDIIISDQTIPPLYQFGVSDIEIIPAEAVCGIIEIKRSLNKKSIASAISHLSETKKVLEVYNDGIKSKMPKENPAIGKHSSFAPIYGIIGLESDKNAFEKNYVTRDLMAHNFDFVDLIWSISDGSLITFMKQQDGTKRLDHNSSRIPYNQEPFGLNVNSVLEENYGQVFRMGLTALRIWISYTKGYPLNSKLNLQYFNTLS